MPTPSDLKSRTCIVHYQKKKSKSGELKKVVVFGQVKEDVGEDCTGFGPIWKIGTNAMEALDLIITCDTATAHLAGALARPTWVALKKIPDWRFFF